MKKHLLKHTLLIITFILFCFTSDAQIIKAYVAGGCNLSQIDGDQAYGYKKFGANVGIGVNFNILPFMSASIEANFNQKGAKQKATIYNIETDRTGAYKININYAEIPILLYFTDKDQLFKFGVGFSYARMVNNAREECYRTDHSNYIIYNKTDAMISYADFVPVNESLKNFEYYEVVKEWNEKNGKLNSNDFSVIASIEARIWQRLKFEVRFAYSLKHLRTSDYYRQYVNEIPDGVETYQDGEFLAFKRKEYNNTLSFRLIYVFNERQAERNKALISTRQGDLR
ncbi:MAG: PorT family protein [Bacteroidales bacterium]|jgi:hypothetical protein|nr:PorT family protein [Bacteroidales bacterium]